MKEEKLEQALDQISDRHLEEAIRKNHRSRKLPWIGAVAAVLAVVILLHTVKIPVVVHAKAIAEASESRIMKYPDSDDYGGDWDAWREDLQKFEADMAYREAVCTEAVANQIPYFQESTFRYLTSSPGENRVWSPVNGFVALAMLAEATAGSTRQELLNLLHTNSVETLRSQVTALWESCYQEKGQEVSKISNSLWLDQSLSWNQETANSLAHHYYASVYEGDLGSKKMRNAIGDWVSQETGGLLNDSAGDLSLPPELSLVLASTVYLHSKWAQGHDFSRSKNTQDIFHSPQGDIQCTFMNKKEEETHYFWSDSYGAVTQPLSNGCTMWLILPDQGKTPEDVLREGQYYETITSLTDIDSRSDCKYMKVNLSVPKLDIASSGDLKDMLQQMGLTEVFSRKTADFSALLSSEGPVWVDSIQQAARVQMDEDGVTAGSYLVIPGAGAAQPPEEVINFVLDRPFLFAITRSGAPMFTGIVTNP